MRHPHYLAPVAALILAAGCDSPSGSGARACGGDALELAVGEAMELEAERDCDFGQHAGAEYALAYADGRAIDLAETGAEPYAVDDRYSVTVTDLLAGGAQAALTSLQPGIRPPHGESDWIISPAGGPRAYEGASGGEDGWVVGEEVQITNDCPPGQICTEPYPTRDARVVRVYDGWLAVAAVESEVQGTLAPMLELLDQAVPIVREHALPLLASSYTATPRSAAGGQMLVLLEDDNTPSSGRAFTRWSGAGQPLSWISLEPFAGRSLASTAGLLAHELAHTWQFAYMAGTRGASVQEAWAGAARWGVEGGASLISYEALRRAAGMPLDANYDFRSPGAGELERYFALRSQPAEGELAGGYEPAMGFFRDLVIRRVRDGEAVDDAVREVSRGVIEGWSGVDRHGSQRPGLTTRMQDRIADWEPQDAVLTWTLSHAGDDLTDNPLYQDRASLRVWQPARPDYGWFPEAVLEGGGGSVQGETLYGSPGYFILRDTGQGVAVRVAASVPGVRWRVLRIR